MFSVKEQFFKKNVQNLMSPFYIVVSKPMLTEFGIHYRLESCAKFIKARLYLSVIFNHLMPKIKKVQLDITPVASPQTVKGGSKPTKPKIKLMSRIVTALQYQCHHKNRQQKRKCHYA